VEKPIYLVMLFEKGVQTRIGVTTDRAETVSEVVDGWSQKPERLPAEESSSEEEAPEETPMCAVHDLPMVWQKGRKGYFWSCHEKKADGSWCDYKPPR
jgi:hypothetical protein